MLKGIKKNKVETSACGYCLAGGKSLQLYIFNFFINLSNKLIIP